MLNNYGIMLINIVMLLIRRISALILRYCKVPLLCKIKVCVSINNITITSDNC